MTAAAAAGEPFYDFFDETRRSSRFSVEKNRSESPPVMVHVIQIPNSKKERSVPKLRMPNLKFYGDLPWIVVIVQSILIICLLLFFFTFLITRDGSRAQTSSNEIAPTAPPEITFLSSTEAFTEATESAEEIEEFPLTKSTIGIPSIETPGFALVGKYQKAAVVSKDETCSEIGRSILIRGGNAVDAMIATVVCVNAANFGDAMGGGFVMTLYNSTTKTCTSVDALPTAPSKVSETVLKQRRAPESRFIATPGTLNGLYRLYEKYGSGKVFWSELLMPTVELCRRGFPVSREIARIIHRNHQKAKKSVELKKLYTNPETLKLFTEGDIVHRYSYADSLEALAEAEDPVDLFYRGEMAEIIVDEMKNNSFLAMNDLEDYETIFYGDSEVMSNSFSFHNTRICGPPPPSTYILAQAVTATVRELQQYSTGQDIRFYHNLIEAARQIELKRISLGDMDYSSIVKELSSNISNPVFANHIANAVRSWPRAIDEGHFEKIQTQRSSEGSLSIAIVDSKGNAIAASTTANDVFSSDTISSSLGFVWNTQLRSFDLQSTESNSNRIRAGKRATSPFAPLLVIDTTSFKLKAAQSGLDDSASIASFLLRLLFFKEAPTDVVNAPQVQLGFANADIIHDGQLSSNIVDYLTSIGHRVGIGKRKDFWAIIRDSDGSLLASAGAGSHSVGY